MHPYVEPRTLPSVTQHLSWAENNEGLVEIFRTTDSFEINWAIPVVFYAAVHYVDAYLVRFRQRQHDHFGREREVQIDPYLSTIWKDYRRLKNLSRAARYECAPYFLKELNESKLRLASIKAPVYGRLKL